MERFCIVEATGKHTVALASFCVPAPKLPTDLYFYLGNRRYPVHDAHCIVRNVTKTPVVDGARGIKFITDCVQSSQLDSAWVDGSFPMN
jgi:hypothetical protein